MTKLLTRHRNAKEVGRRVLVREGLGWVGGTVVQATGDGFLVATANGITNVKHLEGR